MTNEFKLFVSNLSPDIDTDTLHHIFSPYGSIVEVAIIRAQGQGGRRSAFVRYSSAADCDSAIRNLAMRIIEGDNAPMTVKYASRKIEPILQPRIAIIPQQQIIKYPQVVIKPWQQQQRTVISSDNRKRLIAVAQSAAQQPIVKRPRVNDGKLEGKVYVANLEPGTDETTLANLFEPFGAVLETVVMNRQGLRGRLSGFVRFANPNFAATAVSTLNQTIPFGSEAITVKFAK
jgi:RNA recognition motif-containing protein